MKLKFVYCLLSFFFLTAFISNDWVAFVYPDYFPTPVYNFSNNQLTNSKIELGRVLFYDPILSKDNTISCASCHSPFNAFAHTDHDLSHGINDQIGTRNAPALFNLAWQKSFMWDGAINHLDMQALAPIAHPKEMNESMDNVVMKLQNSDRHTTLFKEAFDDDKITGAKILKALSQFQLTLVSSNSKYDQVKIGTAEFTLQEENGYQLFKQNCNTCHQEPLFSSYEFANNGLPVDPTLNDFGKYTVTKQSKDSLQFKIPSLRNLSYSYPYMHDGRFKKLNEVLNHYLNLDTKNKTLSKPLRQSIEMTSNEKIDLIAFLLTLDDKQFVFNEKHRFPRNILLQNTNNN